MDRRRARTPPALGQPVRPEVLVRPASLAHPVGVNEEPDAQLRAGPAGHGRAPVRVGGRDQPRTHRERHPADLEVLVVADGVGCDLDAHGWCAVRLEQGQGPGLGGSQLEVPGPADREALEIHLDRGQPALGSEQHGLHALVLGPREPLRGEGHRERPRRIGGGLGQDLGRIEHPIGLLDHHDLDVRDRLARGPAHHAVDHEVLRVQGPGEQHDQGEAHHEHGPVIPRPLGFVTCRPWTSRGARPRWCCARTAAPPPGPGSTSTCRRPHRRGRPRRRPRGWPRR